MKTKIKTILLTLTLALSLSLGLTANLALADTPPATPTVQQAAAQGTTDIEQNLQKVINIILFFLQRFTWPIILMIGGLMNNDLLFSGGMRETLLTIWSGVRDLVNILFVLSLILVAVLNIVGAGKEDYEIKKILPRIVIGLIAVNFSFLACKVVLDVVNIVSTGIFALPITQEELAPAKNPTILTQIEKELCPVLQSQIDSSSGKTGNKQAKDEFTKYCAEDKETGKITLTKEAIGFFSQFNAQNASLILAVNLQKAATLTQVSDGVRTIKDLAINSLFSAAFFIIYATAYIALFVALLIRIVVLWIIIAISPLIALGFAIPAVKKQVLEGENDLLTLFKDHALIPIPVAIVMSIGMVMVKSIQNIKPGGTLGLSTNDLGSLTTGMSTVQDILVGMATVAFIWMAVFQALAKGKAAGAVNAIKGAVQGAGTAIAKLPLYAPIIPVKGPSGEVKPIGLASALGGLTNAPQDIIRKREREDESFLNPEASSSKIADDLKKAKDLTEAHNLLGKTNFKNASSESEKKTLREFGEWLEKNKRYQSQIKLPPGVNSVQDFIKKLKEEPEKIDLVEYKSRNKITDGAPQATTDLDQAKKLQEKAQKNGISNDTLKSLTTAANELEQAKSNEASNQAAIKVRAESKKIGDLLQATDKFQTALNSSGSQGVLKPNELNSLKSMYSQFKGKFKNKEDGQAFLKKALKDKQVPENQQEAIIKVITGDTPAVPPAGLPATAAAQAQGRAQPGAGNPQQPPAARGSAQPPTP